MPRDRTTGEWNSNCFLAVVWSVKQVDRPHKVALGCWDAACLSTIRTSPSQFARFLAMASLLTTTV